MAESERADSLVRRSEPLRCIGDALEACSREFTSDAFWADLAKPIRKAIDKCHEQEDALAAGEAELATEARRNAMACLAHLDEQMRQASEAGLFRNEARMIKMVHETMKFDESLRLDSPLDSVAQAAHAMQTEGAQIRQGHAAKNQAKLERIRTAMKPYVFEHVSGSCEMSVKIPVPDATSARDVTCHFSREAIRVSIVGHALQVQIQPDCILCSN